MPIPNKKINPDKNYKNLFRKQYGCNVEFVWLNDLGHKKIDFEGFTSQFFFDTSDIPNYYNSGEVNAQGLIANGYLYLTLENPSDGYRSNMESILKIQGIPEKFKKIKGFHINVLPPIKSKFFWTNSNLYDRPDKEHSKYAYAHWKRKSGEDPPSQMLDLRELETGENLSLIHFGTCTGDDYYPSYVFQHFVENIQKAYPIAETRILQPEDKITQVKKIKIL